MQFEYEKSKLSLVGCFSFLCVCVLPLPAKIVLAISFHNFRCCSFLFFSGAIFAVAFSLYCIFFCHRFSVCVCAVAVISFTYMISLDWIHPGWTAFCSCWPSPWSDLWFSCWKLKWYWPYYWTKSMWLAPCPLSHKHTHLMPRDCCVAQWWMCLRVCVRARVGGWLWMRWWCWCWCWMLVIFAYSFIFFRYFFFLVTCFTASAFAASSSSPLFGFWNWIFTGDWTVYVCARGAETRGRRGRERARCGQNTAAKKPHKLYRTLFPSTSRWLTTHFRCRRRRVVGCARVYCRSVCRSGLCLSPSPNEDMGKIHTHFERASKEIPTTSELRSME